MEDNPSLSPDILARYRTLYSGAFYDRYIRGLWRAAEGVVYDMFDPARHMPPTLPPRRGACVISVDYGTLNPTVFLKWRRGEGDAWICEEEYYWSGRAQRAQKTDGAYLQDLLAFLDAEQPRAIIVDPSAASFLALLCANGLPAQAADNRVLDGIRQTGEALKNGTLLFSRSCAHTRAEFQSYVWDESAARIGEDRPRKEDDHCMDAVRYFVTGFAARQSGRVARRPKRF